MPEGSFFSIYVQCPFFRKDEPAVKRITCEGVGTSETTALYYTRQEDFRQQIRVFCCEHYKKCEIYRAIMEKYEEE